MVILIQVSVQDIHGQKFDVQVQNDAQVLGLKLQIWESRSIPPQNQRLVFAGRQLQDEESLNVAGVQHGSVVFLVQQNEQPQQQQQAVAVPQQAVVQQPAIAYAQPAPQVVQPMNVQQVQPQVVVANDNNNVIRETCCFCIPLQGGALTLIILSIVGHILHLPQAIELCFVAPLWGILLGLLYLGAITIDVVAIVGWGKKNSCMMMTWVWFQVVQLCLCVIAMVGGVTFILVRGVDVPAHHRHHHGQNPNSAQPVDMYGTSTTTTLPPHHKFSGREKAIIGIVFTLAMCIGIAISTYYIRVVHRYAKQVRNEDRNGVRQHVVNGVVYQQV